MKSSILQPAEFKLDGGAMYGIIPKPLWDKKHPADDLNRVNLALRLWVIQTQDKNILIDFGIGDYHGDRFEDRFDIRGQESPLLLALKEISLSPEEITDVVISHLHFDHVGGAGALIDDKMTPLFPQARCHLHKEHYHYALNPTDRDTGSFQKEYFEPLLDYYKKENKIVFHHGQEGVILETEEGPLKFKCSHGHTPFLMHPYNHQFLYLSDILPTSNHLSVPWVMGYDIAPGVTTVDKKEFLSLIIKEKLAVIFEHDPVYWGATLKTDEKGRVVVDRGFEQKESLGYNITT